MISYSEVKGQATSLLSTDPPLGPERLPSAAADYRRLIGSAASEVRSFAASPEETRGHNRDFRVALSRIASIECAAGAPVQRCRTWFHCLSSLAAWRPPDSSKPLSVTDASIWAALAGNFADQAFRSWPTEPDAEATPDRVVYRLMTGHKVEMPLSRGLFDNALWEDLGTALETHDARTASRTFRAIAKSWLEDYEASETSPYDPQNFSTFEPAPNAALAIAMKREHMQIHLRRVQYENFYYVALMLAHETPRTGA